MTRRTLLRVALKLGVLGLAVAFSAAFFYGLLAPERRAGGEWLTVDAIAAGRARMQRWDGVPVWILHRSPAQIEALAESATQVWPVADGVAAQLQSGYRSRRRDVGVYRADTARRGVLLHYVAERPARLPASLSWHGGFVDPGSNAVFDAAGRRYRNTRGKPLAVPAHRFTAEGALRPGAW